MPLGDIGHRTTLKHNTHLGIIEVSTLYYLLLSALFLSGSQKSTSPFNRPTSEVQRNVWNSIDTKSASHLQYEHSNDYVTGCAHYHTVLLT